MCRFCLGPAARPPQTVPATRERLAIAGNSPFTKPEVSSIMGVRAAKRPWEMVVPETEISPGQLRSAGLLAGVLALALTATPLSSREEAIRSQFKYAGGTESVSEGCEGNLELRPEFMTFTCRGGEVSVPYSSITLMQYRSGISRHVRHLCAMRFRFSIRLSRRAGSAWRRAGSGSCWAWCRSGCCGR